MWLVSYPGSQLAVQPHSYFGPPLTVCVQKVLGFCLPKMVIGSNRGSAGHFDGRQKPTLAHLVTTSDTMKSYITLCHFKSQDHGYKLASRAMGSNWFGACPLHYTDASNMSRKSSFCRVSRRHYSCSNVGSQNFPSLCSPPNRKITVRPFVFSFLIPS